MLDKTSLHDKKILVLFNIEFLQVLIEERKFNPENIYYIADNELEYLSGTKIFKVQSYKLSDFTVPALKKLIEGIQMKFDLVFSNPPYNGNIDIKILNEIIDVSDEFVVVHPSTWILDLKDKSKLYKDFKNKISGNVKSLEFFNGNSVFNIGLFVPCMISHIGLSQKISIDFFGEKYDVETLNNVTKFGINWETLVKPFYNQIDNYIKSNNGSVWDKRISNSNVNFSKFHCQISAMIGNHCKNPNSLFKDDFYTLILKDSDKNKGIRKVDSRGATLEFQTELELNNFIDYMKTDFARFCLALLKNKSDTYCGEMELIPWLDFTEDWDDDKLFEKFDVSQELQDYIRDFLPDYYGIRK